MLRVSLKVLFLLALSLSFFTVPSSLQAKKLSTKPATTWKENGDKSIELTIQGQPVLRYMCEPLDDSTKKRRAETYKPYHHVFSPDGKTLLTKGPGGLYPHHRGIYYGFNNITYENGKKCDTWHCNGKTFEQHTKVLKKSTTENSGSHTVEITWYGQAGEPFAIETRTVAAVKKPTGTMLEFKSSLVPTSKHPITLDGDPQHGGFQFRASQHVAEVSKKQTYYLRTDGKGKLGETRNWDHRNLKAAQNPECNNRPWNAMSFVIQGKRFTALYLDHPNNPKPARTSERDYGRFGTLMTGTATKEKPFTVHYKIWIQEGEMTLEACQTMSDTFNKE